MNELSPQVEETHFCAIDEVSVLLVTNCKKIIAKKGSKPTFPTFHRYKGITIIGAVFENGNVCVQIQEEKGNATTFMRFLLKLKHHYGKGRLHTVIDNASFHKTAKVKERAKKHGICFHFQPPHSPQVNAAEEIWRQLKEFIRGRLFVSLEDLKEAIAQFFQIHQTLNIKVSNYFR